MFSSALQELLQTSIKLRPRAIWLSFGDWDPLAVPIKNAGIKIICQVQHLEQVEPALQAGADVIVGQVCATSLNFQIKRLNTICI